MWRAIEAGVSTSLPTVDVRCPHSKMRENEAWACSMPTLLAREHPSLVYSPLAGPSLQVIVVDEVGERLWNERAHAMQRWVPPLSMVP